jgi:hypothetical protein
MIELLEMVAGAIVLYVGAGVLLSSPLWWVGIILGAFAALLTLAVLGRIGGS